MCLQYCAMACKFDILCRRGQVPAAQPAALRVHDQSSGTSAAQLRQTQRCMHSPGHPPRLRVSTSSRRVSFTEERRVYWGELEQAPLLTVFGHLDSRDVAVACCVCSHWQEVGKAQSLWRELLEREFRWAFVQLAGAFRGAACHCWRRASVRPGCQWQRSARTPGCSTCMSPSDAVLHSDLCLTVLPGQALRCCMQCQFRCWSGSVTTYSWLHCLCLHCAQRPAAWARSVSSQRQDALVWLPTLQWGRRGCRAWTCLYLHSRPECT